MKKVAFVELDELDTPVRIFRNSKSVFQFEGKVKLMPYRLAVSAIRIQVWQRTKGECQYCGKPISEQSMHMHEVLHRGKGGEISLANCVGICYTCHFSDFESAHGDRDVRFGEGI